jgi:hypothetical protein
MAAWKTSSVEIHLLSIAILMMISKFSIMQAVFRFINNTMLVILRKMMLKFEILKEIHSILGGLFPSKNKTTGPFFMKFCSKIVLTQCKGMVCTSQNVDSGGYLILR